MAELEGSISGQSFASSFKYYGCDEVNKLNALFSAVSNYFRITFELKTNFTERGHPHDPWVSNVDINAVCVKQIGIKHVRYDDA